MTEREELEAAWYEARDVYFTAYAARATAEADLKTYDNAHKGRNQMTKREKLEAKIKAADAACVAAEVAWNAANDAYHAAEADLKAYDNAHKGEIKCHTIPITPTKY